MFISLIIRHYRLQTTWTLYISIDNLPMTDNVDRQIPYWIRRMVADSAQLWYLYYHGYSLRFNCCKLSYNSAWLPFSSSYTYIKCTPRIEPMTTVCSDFSLCGTWSWDGRAPKRRKIVFHFRNGCSKNPYVSLNIWFGKSITNSRVFKYLVWKINDKFLSGRIVFNVFS